MSQPTPYTPTTDFSQQEANNASGRSTVNTAALDAEFANVETSLGQVIDNLNVIQRDDGKIRDLKVELHTLSPEVLNLIGGFRIPGDGVWHAYTEYRVNDLATDSNSYWLCTVAHTSGATFSSSNWVRFGFTAGTDIAAYLAAAQASATAAEASNVSSASHAADSQNSATAASTSASNAASSATAASTSAAAAAASAVQAANSSTVVADGAVSTAAKIANNIITLNKLARTGTSGQVLTSGGTGSDPYWSAPSAGVASVGGNTGAVTNAQLLASIVAALGYTPANSAGVVPTDFGSGSTPVGCWLVTTQGTTYAFSTGAALPGAYITAPWGGTLSGTWRNIGPSAGTAGQTVFVQRVA